VTKDGEGNTTTSSDGTFSTLSLTPSPTPQTPVNTPPSTHTVGGSDGTTSPSPYVSSFTFSRYLSLGMTHPDVKVLQQTLNALGYSVAVTGAGSKGKETTYYGPATTKAIQKYQCAVLHICSGTPTTNGYGNFGPATRASLNQRGGVSLPVSSVPVVTTPPTPVTGSITSWFTLGTTNSQVKTLQQLLNAKGYTVATTGAGSKGKETNYFGPATFTALKRFQCATLQVCSGTPTTTGYGGTGPKTRAALK